MATLFVQHKVNDYATWRAVYDSVEGLQARGGVVEQAVYRSVDDPNTTLVMHRFGSAGEMRAFMESSELREAMGKAGVIESSMRVEFYEET